MSKFEKFGEVWIDLQPLRAITSLLDQFQAIWSHLDLFGAINLELFKAIASHLEPFGSILKTFGAICSDLEPIDPIWNNLDRFGAI